MKLEYRLTEEALRDFNIYHMMHSPSQQRLLRKLRVLVPVVLLLGAVCICLLSTFSDPLYPVFVFAVSAAVSVVWFARFPAASRKWLDKALQQWIEEGKSKEYVGNFTLELLDGALRETGEGRVTEIEYGTIGKVVEDGNYLYIYIGSLSAVIVPVRAFSGGDGRAAFREALLKKIRQEGNYNAAGL